MDNAPSRYLSFFVYAALAVGTLAVFQQVRGFDFVDFDDAKYLTENPLVSSGLSGVGIIRAFTATHAGMWHPLTTLSHMLDCELFGLNPAGHHLSVLFFHITNTLLLFAVLKIATGAFWQSAFVAGVFAVHPMNVESIAWVAERKNLLSALFWILTIWAYTRYIRCPNSSGYFLTLLIVSMALMSKPTAVTLPLVLLLLDYWPFGRLRLNSLYRLILEKVPFFILSIAVSIITFYVQHTSGITSGLRVYPLHIRIANALLSYVKYISKMFWPRHLAIPYPYHADRLSLWQAAAAAILLIVITILVLRLARIRRYLPVGWLWYLGTLVPVIGLVQAGSQAMADRYGYIPLIGLFIIMAWGVPDLLAGWRYRKPVIGIGVLIALSALVVCAKLQLRYWRNTITLFEHSLAVTDDNYVAHLCLADPLYRQGKPDEAIRHYSQALRIRQSFTNIHNAYLGLGRAFFDKGKIDKAISNYHQALRIKPDFVEAHKRLAEAFLYQGKLDAAAAEYRRALELKPDEPDTLNNLGVVLARQNNFAEAVSCFNSALAISPNNVNSYINLGSALFRQGLYAQAVIELKKAVELAPDSTAAHYHLAAAYASAGRFPEAIATAEKALELAKISKQTGLVRLIESHLALYRSSPSHIKPAN